MTGLGDDELAPAAEDTDRLGLDEALVRQRVVRIDRHEAALGLRDDLLRHYEDVAVEKGPVRRLGARRDNRVGQCVARPDLADAFHAPDRQPAHRVITVLARAPARSGVAMTVSVTTHRRPRPSISVASVSSSRSMTMVPATSRYHDATPAALTGTPSSASIRSAGPFSARPPTMGDTATTDSRRAVSPSRTPARARSGPMDTTGFDGAITTTSADAIASSTPGAARAVSMPSNRTPAMGTL